MTSSPDLLPCSEIDESLTRRLQGHLSSLETQIALPLHPVSCAFSRSYLIDYLQAIQSTTPKALISDLTYTAISRLSCLFTEDISSFFGFEHRLQSPTAHADFLIAVSSERGEREAFARLLTAGSFPTEYLQVPEWQQVRSFVQHWVDAHSILHTHVLGLWLEFDIDPASTNIPIPCVFIHTIPMKAAKHDSDYDWLLSSTLPVLLGHPLSSTVRSRLIQAFNKLPDTASIMDVGVMLSRASSGVRLVYRHLQPKEMIPYLQSLGWTDTDGELASLIEELTVHASRLVLHITITDQGVAPKIGLECSFAPDRYQLETRWTDLFGYLESKHICLQGKKDLITDFMGADLEDSTTAFSLDSYTMAVRIPHAQYSKALIRYLSHVKIVYSPGHPLEAKAYPGVRLFGALSPAAGE